MIDWIHKRCGKSEEAHLIMKDDLAGGRLPSSDFDENAAWWWIMIIAFNLNVTSGFHVAGHVQIRRQQRCGRNSTATP